MTHATMTTLDVKTALRSGRFAWPGGYPLAMLTSDGGTLCYSCVRSEWREVCSAIRDDRSDGWKVEAVFANWEDPSLFCDHCSERIESAYAEEDVN